MRSHVFCFCAYSPFVWRSRLTRWIHGRRESLLWGAGGAVALAVILLSCSTTSRTILAPPSIPGAEFVGSEECATCHEQIVRDFRTATHARSAGERGKRKEHGLRVVPRAREFARQSWRRGGHDHQSAEVAGHLFPVSLGSSRSVLIASSPSGARGQDELRDCHEPHKGIAIKGAPTNIQQKLKTGGLAFLSRNETCFECHTQQRGPFVYEHEAVRQGCIVCHSPHGSVNQRLLNERNATLCLKCHFQEQKIPGHIFIGDVDHSNFLQQGTCWSAAAMKNRTGPT